MTQREPLLDAATRLATGSMLLALLGTAGCMGWRQPVTGTDRGGVSTFPPADQASDNCEAIGCGPESQDGPPCRPRHRRPPSRIGSTGVVHQRWSFTAHHNRLEGRNMTRRSQPARSAGRASLFAIVGLATLLGRRTGAE